MLKRCEQAVYKLWKSYVQLLALSTLPTTQRLLVVYRTFDVPALNTAFKQLQGVFAQPFLVEFMVTRPAFCTLPTGPITTTKLIKE
jgi:hypothetical protein